MLTKNTAELKAEIVKLAADDGALLIFWKYYDADDDPDTGEGSFIGCAAKSYKPAVVADKYGIPVTIMEIGDYIYQGLGRDNNKPAAVAFFSAFGEVLADGVDLSRLHWRYLHETLLGLAAERARG